MDNNNNAHGTIIYCKDCDNIRKVKYNCQLCLQFSYTVKYLNNLGISICANCRINNY